MNKRDFLTYIVECISHVIKKPELILIHLSRTCSFLYKDVSRVIRLVLYNVTDVKQLLIPCNYNMDMYHEAALCYHEFRWKQSRPFICFSLECYGKDNCLYGEHTSRYQISYEDKTVRWIRHPGEEDEEISPEDFFKPYMDSFK